MKRDLRIGIVGSGWPGQQHARGVHAPPDASSRRWRSRMKRAPQNFRKAYAPAKIYPDYAYLLGEREIDAVVICLPNHLHFPATLAALRAGKHVLCEKPPTLKGREMRVLQEEAERRGLVYFFSRQSRFTPGMRTARELIAREELGKIYFAEAVWVRSRGIPSGLGGWLRKRNALAVACSSTSGFMRSTRPGI